MKKVLYFMVALFLASCAEQELYEDIADAPKNNIEIDNQYAYLVEQARWGDGQAYLKLADLYHKGQGVQQDFLGTISMLAMADQYGAISNLEDYMKTLPEEDNMKLFFDAMENFERKNMEASAEMTDRLIAQGSPEGYTLKGIMAVEKGDTIEGRRLISLAVEQGSTFAELLLTVLSDWKGGKSPCVELIKHNYTLVLFPPYCEKNDEYFVPAVAGKPFNNWEGFEALAMIEYQGRDAYGIVVNAAEGWEFKFSDKTFGFDNEYVWLKEEDQSWQSFDNSQFPEATKDTTLVYDWSDNTKYAYKMCDADVYEVELTAKLPAGAPEAGVELMGTFVGGSWQEGIEMDYDAIEEAYTATFKAIEKSEFKFRELGTWNNEIMYFEDEQWGTANNFKVGEEWEFDQETLTATIELDLSDPTEYKWKISSSEGIENVVLTEKAHKVVVDGAIYIVRDNKMFNIHGAQVR